MKVLMILIGFMNTFLYESQWLLPCVSFYVTFFWSIYLSLLVHFKARVWMCFWGIVVGLSILPFEMVRFCLVSLNLISSKSPILFTWYLEHSNERSKLVHRKETYVHHSLNIFAYSRAKHMANFLLEFPLWHTYSVY